MKLKFYISYRTEWGQQMTVDIAYHSQDGTERRARLPMQTQDGEHWTAETAVLESRRSPVESFSYSYAVTDAEEKVLRREWNTVPRRYAFDSTKNYRLMDQWRDLPLPAHLYSKAYRVTKRSTFNVQRSTFNVQRSTSDVQHSTFNVQRSTLKLPLFRRTVLFRVSAPQLEEGQLLAVVGSHPALGSWNPARYLPMEASGQGDWMLTLNVDWMGLPLEYKYVVVDAERHELVKWEEGDNRVITDELADGEVYVAYGQPLRVEERPWRAAGVSIPVFSLRSEHSCGVGDFGDLYRFVEWAAKAGMKVVQVLPVNDTRSNGRWNDSHPYNIVSTTDLHPHYIDLEQLGPLKDKERMTAYRRQQRELNAPPYSDYEAVERVKTEYLRAYYEENKDSCGETDFDTFVQEQLRRQLKRASDHAHELGVALMGDLPIGVAAGSREVEQNAQLFDTDSQAGTPPDSGAPQGHNWGFPTYRWTDGEAMQQWMGRRLEDMGQYFDALRLDHVLGYFRIWEIPGDQLFATMGHFAPALPLTAGEIEFFGLTFRRELLTKPFISDRVVDRLFGIHAQYVKDTFLTRKAYGFYELKEEVSTQRRIEKVFDGRGDENSLWIRDGLYRLVANVLFLEDPHHPEMFHPRIQAWREPVYDALSSEEKEAFMRIYNNFFFQRHSLFWGKTGYDRLDALQRSTDMLLCAEDLGMLPDCVEPVLDGLRILTLEVQRMPKHAGEEFTHLDGNPVRSVATISTHDMAPLRLWWEENPERTQRFYTTMLQKQGRAPEQLPAHLAEEIIARHLYSPSMLCILSLQDWLAMDKELRAKNVRQERINTPDDPFNRWEWRMHLTIEQLMDADRYNTKLRTMIQRSKRIPC